MNYLMTLKRALSLSLIVGFLCIGAVGCGDDEEENPPAGSGGSGGSGGTSGDGGDGGGGTSGDGGDGGGGTGGDGGGGTGGGGTGGMAPPDPVMCGSESCAGAMVQGTPLPPCCDTVNGNICGLRTSMMDPMECTGLMQPGTEVPTTVCPTILNALEMPAKPCCNPAGKCGFISGSLMGCIERSIYPIAFLGTTAETTSMFPLASMDCEVPDEDAGM